LPQHFFFRKKWIFIPASRYTSREMIFDPTSLVPDDFGPETKAL
jgi:hypothetical protein